MYDTGVKRGVQFVIWRRKGGSRTWNMESGPLAMGRTGRIVAEVCVVLSRATIRQSTPNFSIFANKKSPTSSEPTVVTACVLRPSIAQSTAVAPCRPGDGHPYLLDIIGSSAGSGGAGA
jgi:hypothetical protein